MKRKLIVLSLIGALLALVSVSFALGTTPRPVKFSAR